MAKRIAKAGNTSQPGRLRIVAGKWRSRLLRIADVPGLRPTSERIRETVFNWLTPRLAGARCLDLFAGTGALGLEALSRGAAETVFVEKSQKAVRTLRDNIAALQSSAATVHNADAMEFLQTARDGKFDIVFLDPPFAADMLGDLCRLLATSPVLASGAWIYLEEDRAKPEVLLPEGWQVIKTRNAGNVRFSLVSVAIAG
ncbi:MAG: 16S rRNA (guanine(966)-N(2))-methyltransferase RsmD [Gammaproteobacteria bacterium]|nr:16S rRNA (guanine(966)-N(2))-methyltransferase RsmD [Gammaproteobacteria bacterium]MDH3372361.1 16S rRNA (guanine(966)-N(2))-methyltransferase RsmD [Gammaproteobacteria bacterium]MDH3408652.1 16S rRNA (guanine(966)-N(2))-methyltransferase RsmD [Gammaproteobacteria bacterium]